MIRALMSLIIAMKKYEEGGIKINKNSLTVIWRSVQDNDHNYRLLLKNGHPDAEVYRELRDRELAEYVRRGGKKKFKSNGMQNEF